MRPDDDDHIHGFLNWWSMRNPQIPITQRAELFRLVLGGPKRSDFKLRDKLHIRLMKLVAGRRMVVMNCRVEGRVTPHSDGKSRNATVINVEAVDSEGGA